MRFHIDKAPLPRGLIFVAVYKDMIEKVTPSSRRIFPSTQNFFANRSEDF